MAVEILIRLRDHSLEVELRRSGRVQCLKDPLLRNLIERNWEVKVQELQLCLVKIILIMIISLIKWLSLLHRRRYSQRSGNQSEKQLSREKMKNCMVLVLKSMVLAKRVMVL